jgi:hypothetical protein
VFIEASFIHCAYSFDDYYVSKQQTSTKKLTAAAMLSLFLIFFAL